jgi:pyridoxamine 5'-phosphate oxidase
MSIADLRREYTLAGLRRTDLDPDPIRQFRKWFQQAVDAGVIEPSAMTLATGTPGGELSSRIVLLKGIDERGFVFYTNYESRKGKELAANAHAALSFFWAELERQVCVSGLASKLSREDSEAYFKTRPRGARLGAWASHQSDVIANREVLEQRFNEMEAKYPGDAIPLPSFWGGYLLAPTRIEFWQGRPNRLHDRFRYTRQAEASWLIERLSP